MDKSKVMKKHAEHFDKFNLPTEDPSIIYHIPHLSKQIKTNVLIQSLSLRKSLNLYQGLKIFYQDAQTLLDLDRQNSPSILRRNKVAVDKDGTHATPQCFDCGKYNPVYKFCEKCYNVHYCSDGCEIRSKLTHQKDCHLRLEPALDAALQVEVHLGSDLGFNVEVHFQHEMRMSLALRGDKLIKNLHDYFHIDHRPLLPEGYQVNQVAQHLIFKKLNDQSTTSPSSSERLFIANDLSKIVQLYGDNVVLGQLELYLIKGGGILHKVIRQVHNNHMHLVYVFLTCQ